MAKLPIPANSKILGVTRLCHMHLPKLLLHEGIDRHHNQHDQDKGLEDFFGIMATLAAPPNELMAAHTATTAKSFHSKRTLRAKETAEVSCTHHCR